MPTFRINQQPIYAEFDIEHSYRALRFYNNTEGLTRHEAAQMMLEVAADEFGYLHHDSRLTTDEFWMKAESRDITVQHVFKALLQFCLYSMPRDNEKEIRETMTEKWKLTSSHDANPSSKRFKKKYPEVWNQITEIIRDDFFDGNDFIDRPVEVVLYFEEEEEEEAAPAYVEDSPPDYQDSTDDEIESICNELDEIIALFKSV